MTKEAISSAIKNIRNIMRKDAWLQSDVDRMPQLFWLLFLKLFDDRQVSDEMLKKDYKPILEYPYRWRDWAFASDWITWDELKNFLELEEFSFKEHFDENKINKSLIKNDKIKWLLPYLKSLEDRFDWDQRTLLQTLYKDIHNRMLSWYLLKDVVNKITESIDFNVWEDLYTISHIYESLLKEMRDAAGTSGEFYTPRPVVKFMTDIIDPKLWEKVIDTSCGTGWFLVDTYEHIKKQCKSVDDEKILNENTLFWYEKKPISYFLWVLNLILHWVDNPNIIRWNTLAKWINEITYKNKVDIVLTNPPFGWEEEDSISAWFPIQVKETSLLFFQFIMRILNDDWRCAIVVPNWFLFWDWANVKVKEKLLNDFNLYAIVRLPKWVFAPYTTIETNLLFFKKVGTTKKVWYYWLEYPEGKKSYSKTSPIKYEEFDEVKELMKDFKITEKSWIVDIEDIKNNNYNLDIKNPNKVNDFENMSVDELVENIINDETEIIEIMNEIKKELN